ncbi:MAG: HAD hydrolase-like protein [Gemmatimonadaceae bacterium]|nr:HAD hydrolase-like protein [Gemmatimonadaceae bacterium]
MAFRLAIFDFDGTLADSFPCLLRALNAAAARYGFRPIDDREVGELRGRSPWEVMEHIDVGTWQLPMIMHFVRERMAREIDAVALFPGIHEVLEDLASHGTRIAIVSSNSERNIRHVLGARLASLACDYRCDVSMFGKRPKLRQVLAATGVCAADAIAIGDEVRDLRAARGESIPFCAVTWGFTTAPALIAAAPDYVVASVEDLVGVVTRSAPLPAPPE